MAAYHGARQGECLTRVAEQQGLVDYHASRGRPRNGELPGREGERVAPTPVSCILTGVLRFPTSSRNRSHAARPSAIGSRPTGRT
jgi:hypothetical protein